MLVVIIILSLLVCCISIGYYVWCNFNPLKTHEKEMSKQQKNISQSKQIGFKIFKIIILVCLVSFIVFSMKLIYQHFDRQKELKHKQDIISKYVGGNTADFINKVWKIEHDKFYETYEFKDDYTCDYYKSGYTFEFNGETLPSFSKSEKYYYKVEKNENNNLVITVFEIDFNTEHINTIDTLEYFPPRTIDNLYFNETLYGDNNEKFLPDDKPYYENINE